MAVNKDYLSDTEMDTYYFARITAEAQVKLSEASVLQAEAQVKNSRDNLGYTRIRSPEDGVVIERKIDPGQTVAASFQTPELFTIGVEMEKHMYVYASVDEADVGLIRDAKDQSRPVSFTVDAYPGDLFEGKIYQIRLNSTTTQNVVTYPVVIEAPNPGLKLMPGMTADLTFQVESKENVLRVPAAALRLRAPGRSGAPRGPPLRERPAGRRRDGNRPQGHGRRQGREGAEPEPSRLGPGRAVAPGRPRHARPDRQPERRNRDRRSDRGPGRRHRDRQHDWTEVKLARRSRRADRE